ncbi:DUF4965 domain-containing protein [Aeoliella sp. ICT_H6.2]|uniref:DUF4965 domain-containing protein n=1 Tax=Aeoliella straminimaris TaxID=2954799 RepID=A0A9X2FF81_9BACT|nr:glutaminase family protein [Aeoliella straminimaris]MCO6047133.1 DUF4965 domain-containing protein [Aeoliella straminimaris]
MNTSAGLAQVAAAEDAWTPPAFPLVACDPYFSIWSTGKTLVDTDTTHWTGKPHRLTSLIRVDGQTFRLLGATPQDLPAFKQTSHQVLPTRSVFVLEAAGVKAKLTFTTPAVPEDIDLLSRPITYLSYELTATDGKEHEVQLAFAAAGEVAVNNPSQKVRVQPLDIDNTSGLRVGSVQQNVLGKKGDDLRIDWGYFYLAARESLVESVTSTTLEDVAQLLQSSAVAAKVDPADKVAGGEVALALVFQPVEVGAQPVNQWLLLAYDDLYSIEFMHHPLRPYWRRNGLDGDGLVSEALRDYEKLQARCESFDAELMADLQAAGGEQYADIAALAYRQCLAAGKFVADANGQPLQFSKENHSNGCIATSDVFYPMSPQFLLFGPSLAKSFIVPFMEYAESSRWTFPFAPHDLGTYPKANGQVYGGGERSEKNQMPVEESGNMLILMAAIARLDGNADFADRYWPRLVEWAEYLRETGFDPENQLCTDDFAGHMAHNVNLSAKAICGLGAFAQLCELRGDTKTAEEYRTIAQQYAQQWMNAAKDGDHYRLAFDKPGTWSQKYNLVWDRVLGLNLFPDSVLRKEMDYYREVQNKYGLPLDNRKDYTKLDWILWTATLTQNEDDFTTLVAPVHRFLNDTPNRSPMTDWYQTKTGKKVGFTARPVVGGVFMQLLHNGDLWDKWASRDQTQANGYADLPRPPKVTLVVPTADSTPMKWQWTSKKPADEWMQPEFDSSAWREGRSGFGTRSTPGALVATTWNTSDIWLRRTFDLKQIPQKLKLHIHHDEEAEVYLNGVLAGKFEGYTSSYENYPISDEALATLKPTGNVIAVHCHQSEGGQYIDVGLATVEYED